MKPVTSFISIPVLPERIEGLKRLANNLKWTWDLSTIELFRRLDSDLWETTNHNPVKMLGVISQRELEHASQDDGFLAHYDAVCKSLDNYLAYKSTWYQRISPKRTNILVAYFSAEFGLNECLSIFAGGLGILAGDHLKSASDLGVPLVGVGLLYQQGYFRQYLNEAGWQQEVYEDNDFYNLPLTLERKLDGSPATISVNYPGRVVIARIWRAQVGRVPLYLLDTNVSVNQPEDRDITDQLYGGDNEMRLKQEILLGIGGYKALETLGLRPTIYHMNEGHSAFLSLERVLRLMQENQISFWQAFEAASAGMVFTTHTPVAAGHDYFSPGLMDRYFSDYYRLLGISRYDFLALGRLNPNNDAESFCMTTLALRMASYSNGVSRLHGKVSREMWKGLWQNFPIDELPITHVTNGVHIDSWISRDMEQLFARYLGAKWREDPEDQLGWQRVERIPAEELWRSHERRRERLVAFSRRRLAAQLTRRGSSPAMVRMADEALNPDALTIGFARRFATYKRATLIFHDPDRLFKILSNPDRPVQLIIAGKAHPKDDPGKELIRKIVQFANQDRFRRKIIFIEDYDMTVARYMIQGCDIWLNTPLRPQEASGTSGMKAAANGVLNVSTLDGWWDEAYNSAVGWAIGRAEVYQDAAYQEQVEAEALYTLLENEIVPVFYERGSDGLPRRWIQMMKTSIQTLSPFFNTHRMVGEYTQRFYIPGSVHYLRLADHNLAKSKTLAEWKARIKQNWNQVKIEPIMDHVPQSIEVGGSFETQARVILGSITPEDVRVELYLGPLDANGNIIDPKVFEMELIGPESEGVYRYQVGAVVCCSSGLHGYTIRVLPNHPDLVNPVTMGKVTWA